MAGLTAIILHHSFFRQIRTRIDCDGHTSLTGTNGAGKTTTLLLIPIFYGEEPGRVVTQAAGKDRFVDHFLPNAQSMIVFEYARSDGHPCCAVLYRQRGQEEMAYRFVEGGASDTVFHPDLEPLYEAGEPAWSVISTGLTHLGVFVSNQIYTAMDYRSIIQNDPYAGGKRRQRGRAEFTMVREAARFSMARSSSNGMQHVESLAGVVLNKSRLISSLEDMVVDSMVRPRIDLSPPSLHHKNQGLWEDIKSFQAFRKSEERLREAVALHASLQSSRIELDAVLTVVANQMADTERTLEAQQGERVKLEQSLVETKAAFEQRESEIQSRISEHASDVQSHRRWLEKLGESEAAWERVGIVSWREKLEMLAELRQRAAQGKSVLRQMQASSKAIQEQHAGRVAEIHEGNRLERTGLSARFDRAQEGRDQLREQHMKAMDALADQQREARGQLQEVHEIELARRAGEMERAEQQGALESRRTGAEEERITQSSAAAAEASAALATAEEVRSNTGRRVVEATGTRDDSIRNHERAEKRAQKERDELDRLSVQLAPPQGSLLAFLRGSPLAWQTTIGRAVNPDLLTRKDLAPRLVEHPDQDQMYGLRLDLEAVDAPDAVDDLAVLEEKVNKARQRLQTAQSEVDRLAQNASAARLALERVKTELASAELEVSKAGKRVERADANARKVTDEIDQAVRSRSQAVAKRLEALRIADNEQRTRFRAETSDLEGEHRAEREALRAAQDRELEESESVIASVRRALGSLEDRLQQQLSEQDALRREALTERGIDPDRIAAKESEIERLEREINKIEAYRERVFEYESWLKVDWGAKPDREARLREAQALKRGEEQRLHAAREQFAQERQRFREMTERLSDAIRGGQSLQERRSRVIGSARECLEAVPDLRPPEERVTRPESAGPTGLDVDDLVEVLNRTVEERRSVHTRIRDAVEQIGQHPGTRIHEEWANLREARRERSAFQDPSDAFFIELMQELRVLLEERVPQIERAIIVNVHAIGGALNEYHDKLKNLDQVTSQVTRTLERELNAEHDFGEITDVKVVVRSKIHEFGFWKSLRAFAGVWKEWANENFSGLPKDALLSAMTGLDHDLKASDAFTRDLKNLVSLEIQFREQGRLSPIRRNEDLKDSSSHGLSSIAILILFSALTRYLCPDPKITITWPIDEIGTLSPENVRKVFRMMARHNIHLLCAEPKVNRDLDPYFRNHFRLERTKGAMLIRPPEESAATKGENPLVAAMGVGS